MSGIMPAALDVDRTQVQMLALTYGVREAARMLGLPESTVKSWCTREGWLEPKPVPPTVIRPASNASIAPINALQNSMKGDALGGRAYGLRITRRALENIDKSNTDAQLCTKDNVEMIGSLIKSAATAGGYGAQDSVAKIQLAITSQSQTIEAEIVSESVGGEELP